VRDGINLARLQVPAIALVTTDFARQGNFIARASGMPEIPRVELPHPIAGSGAENMEYVAGAIVEKIADVMAGNRKGEILWEYESADSGVAQ
jgi:hypothetical protein